MSYLISGIIPVHNGERFLRETVDSILAQSHPLAEVIVVDDGSTDGTRGVVEDCAATAAIPIRYCWQENGGPAAARNTGIQAATGDFVAFLDADDLWHAEKTARQLARFAEQPELGVSVTNVQNFWMEEVREEEARLQGHARTQAIAGYVATTFLGRRSVFEQVGRFDATLQHANMAEWFMRANAQNIRVELLPEVLVYRRLHRDNRSRKLANNSRAEHLRVMHAARKHQQTRERTDADVRTTK